MIVYVYSTHHRFKMTVCECEREHFQPTSLFTHFNSCQKIKQIQCLTCVQLLRYKEHNNYNSNSNKKTTTPFSILLNRFLIIVNTSLIVEYIINCSIINHLVYNLDTVLDSDTCRTSQYSSSRIKGIETKTFSYTGFG